MPELTTEITEEDLDANGGTISIEFSVYCGKCRAGLCGNTVVDHRYGRHVVVIDPCEKCLTDARQEGYDSGYEAGHPRISAMKGNSS